MPDVWCASITNKINSQ